MDKYKISAEEFAKVSISRLATHPNTSTAFGESKMSEQDLKKRFDKQGELFRAKFNAFLEIIGATGDGESLAGKILTGISEDHTLKALFEDIVSEDGRFASYLSVGDMTLMEKLKEIAAHEEEVKQQIEAHKAEIEERLSKASQEADEKYVQKVVKKNGISVYTTSEQEPTLAIAQGTTVGSIARRYNGGRLRAGDPVEELDAVNLGFAAKTYVGKTGNQTIDGGLTVKGDFIVEGDNYRTEVEVLNVKDAVIVANSDGVPLTGLSGYVLRTANGDYGILYDPAEDCVKIGLGVYVSETKTFTFNEGEAQPLATRGVIADGNIPVWDAVKRTFVDGGLSIEMLKAEIEAAIEACVKDTEPQEEAVPSSVPKRGESGELAVGDPVDDGDAVNLGVMGRKTANALIGEKSGGAVVIDDVAPDYKVLSVVSSIEPVQASGTPSPDNVLPISPWTGAKLTKCGKNLLPYPYTNTTKTENGITFTDNGDGSVSVQGTATSNAAFHFGTFKLKKGVTYTLSSGGPDSGAHNTYQLWLRNDAGILSDHVYNIKSGTAVTPEKEGNVTLSLMVYSGNTVDLTYRPQIEVGSSATEYEPYVSDTIEIDFGQEVYGGTIDWSTGVLTVDRVKHICTADDKWSQGSTLSSYSGADSRMRYQCSFGNTVLGGDSNLADDTLLCSKLPTVSAMDTWKNTEGISSFSTGVYVYIEQYATDFEGFKEMIVGTEIVYRLKEPYTIQLAPQQVEALTGTNTVFCDTGESAVTYNRDINKAFAELQQAIISLGGNI